jgi:hypothetical protein
VDVRDAWTCVEWEIRDNGTQAWSNATPIDQLTLSISSGDVIQLSLGWLTESNQAARPLDLWLDDLMVATDRVGCD